jgi:hypothetical protein
VRSALLADPGLSERQKQVLIEIYESFRKENAVVEDHDAPVAVLPYAGPAEVGPGLAEAETEPWLPEAEVEAEPPEEERPGRTGRARRRDGTWAAVTDDATDTGHNG